MTAESDGAAHAASGGAKPHGEGAPWARALPRHPLRHPRRRAAPGRGSREAGREALRPAAGSPSRAFGAPGMTGRFCGSKKPSRQAPPSPSSPAARSAGKGIQEAGREALLPSRWIPFPRLRRAGDDGRFAPAEPSRQAPPSPSSPAAQRREGDPGRPGERRSFPAVGFPFRASGAPGMTAERLTPADRPANRHPLRHPRRREAPGRGSRRPGERAFPPPLAPSRGLQSASG